MVGLVGIAALVPATAAARAAAPCATSSPRFRNGQVWLAMAMTVLGFGGVFAAFTYIAPMMTEVAGFSAGAVTWLLVLFGVGLVVGNLVGGRLADRALMPMLYTALAVLAVLLRRVRAHRAQQGRPRSRSR